MRGIYESDIGKMSLTKRPGAPRTRHLSAKNFENVSSETGWTTVCATSMGLELRDVSNEPAWCILHAASLSLELCGCLRQIGLDNLVHEIYEPGVAQMCQTSCVEHSAPGTSEPRVKRMPQTKLAGRPCARHLGA